MTSGRAAQDEPKPIEAEFEPSYAPEPRSKKGFAPTPMRSRSATIPEMLLASAGAAVLGAVMAIAVTNANSGAETGTLAREIDSLTTSQTALSARADRMSEDLVTIRSRLESQAERLARQDEAELSLRGEIATVAGQVSALTGAGAPEPGATAGNTPLGILLARLTRLETILADDAASPQTTRQVQRMLTDLTSQVEQLYVSNTTLTETLAQREATLAAIETSLGSLSGEVEHIKGEADTARRVATGLGILKPAAEARQTSMAIAAGPKTVRAFSLMELAAQRSDPFATEQQALALLLPDDPDVARLAETARKGAPTAPQLKKAFELAARSTQRVVGTEGWGWTWLRASSPEVSDATGAEARRLIEEARQSLDEGDLRGAASAVTSLPVPASSIFAPWRDLAIRRAELDERLARLNQRLTGAAPSTEG
jgi:hypothetical protein